MDFLYHPERGSCLFCIILSSWGKLHLEESITSQSSKPIFFIFLIPINITLQSKMSIRVHIGSQRRPFEGSF